MLNARRALLIYLSFIIDPSIGSDSSTQRHEHAVDIFRTLVALGRDQSHAMSSKTWVIFLAGVAFGGASRSSQERQWVSEKFAEVAAMFPVMKKACLAYERLLDAHGNFWEEMEKARVHVMSY